MVGGTEKFVPLALDECTTQLGIAQSQFPIQQAAIIEFAVVELSEGIHGNANLIWNLLEELGIFLVVGPMSLCQNFHREVNFEGFRSCVALELLAELLRHFHVLEHDFKALGELASTLFLQFEDQGCLSILADVSLLEKPLGKATHIEALKNVLVKKVSEDVNNFVEAISKFTLLNILKVFLEHFVQVEDKGFSCAIVDIHDFFEGHLDCHINLRILLHGLVLNGADTFT